MSNNIIELDSINIFNNPPDYVLNKEDKNIYTKIRCEIINLIDIDDKKGLFHIQFYIKTYTKISILLI